MVELPLQLALPSQCQRKRSRSARNSRLELHGASASGLGPLGAYASGLGPLGANASGLGPLGAATDLPLSLLEKKCLRMRPRLPALLADLTRCCSSLADLTRCCSSPAAFFIFLSLR